MNEELLVYLSEDPFEKNNLIHKKLYESEKQQLMEYYQEWKNLVGEYQARSILGKNKIEGLFFLILKKQTVG